MLVRPLETGRNRAHAAQPSMEVLVTAREDADSVVRYHVEEDSPMSVANLGAQPHPTRRQLHIVIED